MLALCLVASKLTDSSSVARAWGGRLAAVTFVVYAGYALVMNEVDVLHAALRAALVSGLVLGLAWLLLPVLLWLGQHTVGALWHALGRGCRTVYRCHAERRRRRASLRDAQRAQADYTRRAPERERARQDAETRAQTEAVARQRREDVRARCELFFTLHEQDLAKCFAREHFQTYLERYLGEDRSPEYVEERGQRLLDILQQALEKVRPARKFSSLEQINAWFDAQLAPVLAMPDGPTRQTLEAQLRARRDELLARYMEELGS